MMREQKKGDEMKRRCKQAGGGREEYEQEEEEKKRRRRKGSKKRRRERRRRSTLSGDDKGIIELILTPNSESPTPEVGIFVNLTATKNLIDITLHAIIIERNFIPHRQSTELNQRSSYSQNQIRTGYRCHSSNREQLHPRRNSGS